jgi:hypothetical protein
METGAVMLEQNLRRLSGFQSGVWVVMGDGQRWMFPHPPTPGTDHEYDALLRCLLQSEDLEEAWRIELALSILLFSRNYDPQPSDYEAIFDFGADQGSLSLAQAAISTWIYADLATAPLQSPPRDSRSMSFLAVLRTVRRMRRSFAARSRFPMGRRVHFASPARPSASRKLP